MFYDYSDKRWTVTDDNHILVLGKEGIETTRVQNVERLMSSDRQTFSNLLAVQTRNSIYLLRTTCCDSLDVLKIFMKMFVKTA